MQSPLHEGKAKGDNVVELELWISQSRAWQSWDPNVPFNPFQNRILAYDEEIFIAGSMLLGIGLCGTMLGARCTWAIGKPNANNSNKKLFRSIACSKKTKAKKTDALGNIGGSCFLKIDRSRELASSDESPNQRTDQTKLTANQSQDWCLGGGVGGFETEDYASYDCEVT